MSCLSRAQCHQPNYQQSRGTITNCGSSSADKCGNEERERRKKPPEAVACTVGDRQGPSPWALDANAEGAQSETEFVPAGASATGCGLTCSAWHWRPAGNHHPHGAIRRIRRAIRRIQRPGRSDGHSASVRRSRRGCACAPAVRLRACSMI